MAITIKVEPQELQPVYNPIITVLSSTNSSKENYQYIVDVNINGTAQSRMKIQPNPNGYGVLDLHKHIEPYITYDYTNTLTDLTEVKKASNSFVGYDITLSEEYIPTLSIVDVVDNGGGTVQITTTSAHGYSAGQNVKISGVDIDSYNGTFRILTVSTSLFSVSNTYTGTDGAGGTVRLLNQPSEIFTASTVFTGSKYAWNGVIDWVPFSTYNNEDFDVLDYPNSRLLTSLNSYGDSAPASLSDWSNAYEVTPNSRMYLNSWNKSDHFNFCQITSYDSNGTYISDVDSDAVQSGTTDNEVIRLAVGPWNINNSGNGGGYGSNFLTGATYYTVKTEDSAHYLFKIVDDCSKYETYQFLFLDRLGSFIPVTFNLLSKKGVSIAKGSYKKSSGSYDPTTNTWGYNTYDRGKTRLSTKVNEVITVNSDWVSETMSGYINEMMASPEVYHIDEDGNSYGIDILTSGYEVKTRLNDKLIDHTFNFEYSFKNNQQN